MPDQIRRPMFDAFKECLDLLKYLTNSFIKSFAKFRVVVVSLFSRKKDVDTGIQKKLSRIAIASYDVIQAAVILIIGSPFTMLATIVTGIAALAEAGINKMRSTKDKL